VVTVEEIMELLHLRPLPAEGGYYAESYRAVENVPAAGLPERYGGPRAHGTAIYYLLVPGECSRLHRLRTDEVWHFYLGDPVEMLQLGPAGAGQMLQIGADLAAGQRPQVVVPRGTWMGARLAAGGRCALLGTTMAPGFDATDFEAGRRQELLAAYPAFREAILALTEG
jgi:hypothetical protein